MPVLRAPIGAGPSRVDTSSHFVKRVTAVCHHSRKTGNDWKDAPNFSHASFWLFLLAEKLMTVCGGAKYLFVAWKRDVEEDDA
jgi:hypothetical protein